MKYTGNKSTLQQHNWKLKGIGGADTYLRENDFQLEFCIQPNHQLKIKIDYKDIFMHHKSLKQRNNSRKESRKHKGKMGRVTKMMVNGDIRIIAIHQE